MKLSYRLATISYCPDLTDPEAVSWPIAVVSVGRDESAGGPWIASAVGIDAKRLGLDPLSAAMLADVPHMIRRHVDLAMKALTESASPEIVLDALRESLKTSIHVSAIGERRHAELADPRLVAALLVGDAAQVLEAELRRFAEQAESTPAQASAWKPRVAPERLMEPAPEQLFWQPPSPMHSQAIALH